MKNISIKSNSCELFNIPFFQFSQMKKYCPDLIDGIKTDYRQQWQNWKNVILHVSTQLGTPFSKPHIESWTNGWQVRAHFFAYFKYECYWNSAVILSVLLNRRRLSISLDWHAYKAKGSITTVQQYNQWLDDVDFQKFADFDIWRGDESEYADFFTVNGLRPTDLTLRTDEDFWCIGKNVEKSALDRLNTVEFIIQTIRELQPLYEACHK